MHTSFKPSEPLCGDIGRCWPGSSDPGENGISSRDTGMIVAEYRVGGYMVRLVKHGDGVFRYEARLLVDEELVNLVKSRLRDILLHIRRGVPVTDVASMILGIPRESSPQVEYVLKMILGYRVLQVLLDDPYVEDISITGPGTIWVRHRLASIDPRVDFIETNLRVESIRELVELQQLIALKCNTYISASRPIVDAQLPIEDGGHRVHLVSPIVAYQHPEIVVRKRPGKPPSIDELVKEKALPLAVAEYFKLLINKRMSLIIAGPPGSGKTTLLRSILYSYIPLEWKVVIIEDTGEIDPPPGSAWARYTTVETGSVRVDLFTLAKAALRSSATRVIVIGETRGSEAQVLVQAMLSGMSGLTTFHGGTPREVVTRLISHPINLTPSQVGMFTAVAFMGFSDNPRRILTRVVELTYNPGRDSVEYSDIWVRERDGLDITLEEILKRSRRIGGAL
ncbi:type II/IV secretion system ATPase subunit [Desulfurococcus amylolyticus]|uniref:type II/IV secretion system ATPase subunit n=1 Tax=Desulfurococcus amylolyticus TaxID=94694 RepID=UPI0023F38997|nr:type II/IV secretion system ATPase subunit [Desulfurococcus amylolyticus]